MCYNYIIVKHVYISMYIYANCCKLNLIVLTLSKYNCLKYNAMNLDELEQIASITILNDLI